MARIRVPYKSDEMSPAALTAGGTTFTFNRDPGLATLAAGDLYAITIDPGAASEETVYLTAYTAGALTGTISRGQDGTTAVAHVGGAPWVMDPKLEDRGADDLTTAQTIAGSKYFTGASFRESFSAPLTAFAGGGQAGATPLPAMFNRVTISAATAPPFDSVLLPAALGGQDIIVVNATNNPIQVFGTGTDTINGVAAATGITQAPNSVEAYFCTAAGSWNVDPGIGFSGQLFTELAQDNIVALAGGGQAGATLLWAQTSRIATVATAGDSIRLPVSAPGLELLVINHGANSMQVYGSGTDTIDDVATATGVSQMVNSMVIYTCATAGKWYSNGIGTGFSGQFPTVSFLNGITAFAGGGQAGAVLLSNVINRVTTVATASDSVKLPASAGGMQITVTNAAAVNPLNIYPSTGDQINALGVNAPYAVVAGKTAAFSCAVAGQWHAVLGA